MIVIRTLLILLIGGIAAAQSSADESAAELKLLIVVDREDDRSKRLVDFLEPHGINPALTTYEKVTKALCDAHDVVLADSKLFKESRRALKHAIAFPKTTAPLIAVGFLGTQLIERHGVAMTSGYI